MAMYAADHSFDAAAFAGLGWIDKNVKEGDEVLVFGESLPLQKIAEWAQTIPYEIMTGISQRVKRIYLEE